MNYSPGTILYVRLLIISIPFLTPLAWAENNAIKQHDIITVSSTEIGATVTLGGTVEPKKIVNLSAQMPGDISFVAGSEGDSFQRGDILIALDTNALLAKREQVIAQLANAKAGHRNAIIQYNHELENPNSQANAMLGGAPSLFGMFGDPMRSITGQGNPDMERHASLYAMGTQIETAQNGVNQAYAALREIDEALNNAASYAPFDGVIVKKMVEKGDIVQPGMPLISFADVTRLQIRAEVPTQLLRVVKMGGLIHTRLDGYSNLIKVSVDRIFPMAAAGGHTTTVKFRLPRDIVAHSGMYAEIILPDPTSKNTALPVIPYSAIVWRGSLPAVFQVTENGKHRLRLIRVDEQAIDGYVSVISGINVGDKILAQPSNFAASGRQ